MSMTPTVRWRLFADEDEPTSRERGMRVYEELQRQGWDAGKWDGKEQADVIVLQYSLRDLDKALATGAMVVADVNDMVWLDGHAYRDEFLRGVSRVHAVVAGSPRLAQHLQRRHPLVTMIEQAVGPQYWTVKPQPHEGLHLFWMGMHDNIVYFSEIDEVLRRLAGRHEFTVHFCTSKRSGLDHDDMCGRDNVARVVGKPYPTQFHEWDVAGALEVMARCDVGIAPLYQTEWCWCKCANKALNMMAAGLPVVVSDVPSYRAAIEDGVSGRLCYGPEEWERVLDDVLSDKGNRKRMGEAGRVTAESYSIETIAGQWGDMLREVTAQ